MFRTVRCLAFAITALLAACERERAPMPSAAPSGSASSEQTDPLVYRSRQLAFRLQHALGRLDEPMPASTRFATAPCPDQLIRERAPEQDARTLVLSVHDARYQQKSLLPLSVIEPLLSNEASRAAELFVPDETRLASPLNQLLKSEAHALAAERMVELFEARTYKGVFHVTLFKKAHLIRKLNKRRREWTRGVLRAWLVVYDIDTSESLCQTEIISVNEVDNEPISMRRRADTQQRLVRALGQQLREQAAERLASISSALVLPAADSDGAPSGNALRLPGPSAGSMAALNQPPGMQ